MLSEKTKATNPTPEPDSKPNMHTGVFCACWSDDAIPCKFVIFADADNQALLSWGRTRNAEILLGKKAHVTYQCACHCSLFLFFGCAFAFPNVNLAGTLIQNVAVLNIRKTQL